MSKATTITRHNAAPRLVDSRKAAEIGMFLDSPWLTANEAGHYLKVSSRTVIRWAREGKIKGHKLSGQQRITWRFLQSDLDAMLSMPSGELNRRIQ